ncbi:PREDICTED: uncharacterized protein LOC109226024 [Nicotiana attenuata]|uniref:uncharacterized protein LOC109226024 n=1 Tax=Nicotiana attenuata TaxID=49451 RepID=UPI0009047F2A|nr:PREDICTED: uncharacterized protein LOC109226024 [Nicotiana attenuata]
MAVFGFRASEVVAHCALKLISRDHKVVYQHLRREYGSIPNWPWSGIWRNKAPLKVDCFTWLVAQKACLTQENFRKEGSIFAAGAVCLKGKARWIPGQLCPTVPNRSNYIHCIEDLLSSNIIPKVQDDRNCIRGFDIGTGANCIYPLLGASLMGWKFVGSDVTNVAFEWAEKNVKSNPHLSELIEIRRVNMETPSASKEELNDEAGKYGQCKDVDFDNAEAALIGPSPPSHLPVHPGIGKIYNGPPILVGVVKDGEKFDFCMCNPPFFETIEEAGLNPKTSCGGTKQEMVCPGGENAFITRIIEDSVQLRESFLWYTSMVGRKTNLKVLISKLWEVGATIVKTTDFVQGQTCRWGLAWSFLPLSKKMVPSHVAEKNNMSFMLEGLQRHQSAIDVLQSVESYFCSIGASSKLDSASFNVDVTLSG